MPLITRKEYAELCGDRPDAIVVWIKRRKIWTVPDNKKLIDTENPINAAFASERQLFNKAKGMGESVPKAAKIVKEKPKSVTKTSKKATESSVKLTESEPKPVKKQPLPAQKPAEIIKKDRVLAEQNVIAKAKMDQDFVKRGLEIENLELAKQQKMLQLNKSAGNLLPVDLVKGVVKRHADTVFKTFEKSIERFVSIICGSDQEVYVKHLATVKDILSKTIAEAGALADQEILILINDFSETLARGQKKI